MWVSFIKKPYYLESLLGPLIFGNARILHHHIYQNSRRSGSVIQSSFLVLQDLHHQVYPYPEEGSAFATSCSEALRPLNKRSRKPNGTTPTIGKGWSTYARSLVMGLPRPLQKNQTRSLKHSVKGWPPYSAMAPIILTPKISQACEYNYATPDGKIRRCDLRHARKLARYSGSIYPSQCNTAGSLPENS